MVNENGGTPPAEGELPPEQVASRKRLAADEDPEARHGTPLIERVIAASARDKFLDFIFVLFGITAGIWAIQKTPLDAIPDLSDVQVIRSEERRVGKERRS